MAHTPGPWKVTPKVAHATKPIYVWTDEGHNSVVITECKGSTATANAKLIAQAPAMLEALKAMLKKYPPSKFHDDPEWRAEVTAKSPKALEAHDLARQVIEDAS